MSHKSRLALTVLLILSTSPAFAQGEFVDRGQSCLALLPQLTFGPNSTGYGVNLGYCAEGYLDFGFVYSKNEDTDAKGYGPTMAAHLMKTRRGNGMFGASAYLSFQSLEFPTEDTITFKTTLILVEAALYYNFYISDWLTLQPSYTSTMAIDLETAWEQSATGRADRLDFYQNIGLAMELYRGKQYHPFLFAGLVIPNQTSENVYGSIGVGILAVF
ncbi:MAG: hypothetical protein JSV52_11620 [Candidatus Zixiibacteriota bacterium]|nr:MAG: hypothetical protein JSV52_11620 [candidate division Zixibacteria bacterium]